MAFRCFKRWAKVSCLNKYNLGARLRVAGYPTGVTFDASTGTTYRNIKFFHPVLGWNDKYYQELIPIQELIINPRLK